MKIDIHGDMASAFLAGCSGYLPTLGGDPLAAECCDPDVSATNLTLLLEEGFKPTSYQGGPNHMVLVEFDGGASYLATGFSFGEPGPGAECFAEFLHLAHGGDWYPRVLAARSFDALGLPQK